MRLHVSLLAGSNRLVVAHFALRPHAVRTQRSRAHNSQLCCSHGSSTRAAAAGGTTSSISSTDTGDSKCKNGVWDFPFDGSKLTALVHSTWKKVARSGDTVIDATCGNGHDTLMLARLVCRDDGQGFVYGLDLQKIAVDNTQRLLNRELNSLQRGQVKLIQICHSKLDEVVSDGQVSVIAFNLGYLPGGDKGLITQVHTTVGALKTASRLLKSGGIITIIVYIGHPGGREECEAIREFTFSLPASTWICSHHDWPNRPLCPHLFLLSKR